MAVAGRSLVSSTFRAAIIEHALEDPTAECCGVISARAGRAMVVKRLSNVASDPASRFEVSPTDLHAALLAFDRDGQRLAVIYHSHPSTPAWPSANDVRFAAAWPGVEWAIASLAAVAAPDVRSFLIAGRNVTELTLD